MGNVCNSLNRSSTRFLHMWYKSLVQVSHQSKRCIRTSPDHSVPHFHRSLLPYPSSPLQAKLCFLEYLLSLANCMSHGRSGTYLQICMFPLRSYCRQFYSFLIFLPCSLISYLYSLCFTFVLGGQRSTCFQTCTSLSSGIPSKSSLFSYFLCFAFPFLVNKNRFDSVFKGAWFNQN